MTTHIRLGHSPDPDDAFMFYGLATGALDTAHYQFEHILHDIQTLNDWARQGQLEVTALSVHAYPYLADRYAILSSGASMGATDLVPYLPDPHAPPPFIRPHTADPALKAQGPLVVARDPFTLDQLAGRTVAIPGSLTTAFLVLQLAAGRVDYQVMPFDEIPDAVAQGRCDAGVIIHEGQLTYDRLGLHCVADLGRWWFERTGLVLPLGCNVIRRDLGQKAITQIGNILRRSILFSLEHRYEAVDYALQFARDLDHHLADTFVGMYVNEWTVDYGPIGRQALRELLQQAHQAHLIPNLPEPEFV